MPQPSPHSFPSPWGINCFESRKRLPLVSHGRLSSSPSPLPQQLALVVCPNSWEWNLNITGQYLPIKAQGYRCSISMPWQANLTLCVSSFYSAKNKVYCPQNHRLIYWQFGGQYFAKIDSSSSNLHMQKSRLIQVRVKELFVLKTSSHISSKNQTPLHRFFKLLIIK